MTNKSKYQPFSKGNEKLLQKTNNQITKYLRNKNS